MAAVEADGGSGDDGGPADGPGQRPEQGVQIGLVVGSVGASSWTGSVPARAPGIWDRDEQRRNTGQVNGRVRRAPPAGAGGRRSAPDPRGSRDPDGAGGWLNDRFHGARGMRGLMREVSLTSHWSFLLGEITLWSFVILLLTGTFLSLFFDAVDDRGDLPAARTSSSTASR